MHFIEFAEEAVSASVEDQVDQKVGADRGVAEIDVSQHIQRLAGHGFPLGFLYVVVPQWFGRRVCDNRRDRGNADWQRFRKRRSLRAARGRLGVFRNDVWFAVRARIFRISRLDGIFLWGQFSRLGGSLRRIRVFRNLDRRRYEQDRGRKLRSAGGYRAGPAVARGVHRRAALASGSGRGIGPCVTIVESAACELRRAGEARDRNEPDSRSSGENQRRAIVSDIADRRPVRAAIARILPLALTVRVRRVRDHRHAAKARSTVDIRVPVAEQVRDGFAGRVRVIRRHRRKSAVPEGRSIVDCADRDGRSVGRRGKGCGATICGDVDLGPHRAGSLVPGPEVERGAVGIQAVGNEAHAIDVSQQQGARIRHRSHGSPTRTRVRRIAPAAIATRETRDRHAL